MFRKRSEESAAPTATAVDDDRPVVNSGKGRPTPSRKEAEAARKAALKGGAKPGANRKEQRLAQREEMRKARQRQREAMMRGDERALPARDKGPVRGAVRDFVDSRRSVAEFFIPVAVAVLVMGMIAPLQALVTLLWMLVLVLVIVDSIFMLFQLNKKLKQKWPEKADRKGVNFYAVMRALQIRRLRLPPPRFKAGGRPVVPKAPKA